RQFADVRRKLCGAKMHRVPRSIPLIVTVAQHGFEQAAPATNRRHEVPTVALRSPRVLLESDDPTHVSVPHVLRALFAERQSPPYSADRSVQVEVHHTRQFVADPLVSRFPRSAIHLYLTTL